MKLTLKPSYSTLRSVFSRNVPPVRAPDERERAPALFRELSTLAERLADGARDFSALQDRAAQALNAQGFEVDYVAIRVAGDLSAPASDVRASDLIVLAAAQLGRARLIDNVRVG